MSRVVTSIGPEHLELVGSVEDVARANAEAIEALPAGGVAVVPVDAPELEPYLGRAPVDIRRFDPSTVERVRDGRWRFHVGGGLLELELPFRQRHLAENVLAALTAYDALGLPLGARPGGRRPHRALALAWRAPRATRGRLRGQRRVQREPDLDAGGAPRPGRARPTAEHRRVAVLGEMAELGAASDRYHAEIGALLPELGVDVLVAVGDGADRYREPGVPEMLTVADADAAVEALQRLLHPGDAVLVKASRAVGLEGIAAEIEKIASAW